MSKRIYGSIINTVIDINKEKLVGLNKKEAIQLIYNYIVNNGLILDYSEVSLQNTIYYFLRKANQFSDFSYKLNSVKSKISFLEELKKDIRLRKEHYKNILLINNIGNVGIGTNVPQILASI